MDKSKITKQNGNIAFEEEAHIYYDVTCPEKKFVSVTTLIHSFTQPFDKEFWSAYKALEKTRGKALACTLILKSLDSYQTSYYISLDRYNKYLVGWIDKRIENIPLSQCSNYTLTVPVNKISDENH